MYRREEVTSITLVCRKKWNYGKKLKNAVDKALKKHIPVKPLRSGNTDKPTVDIFICPSCSGVVGIDDTRADYCADCGQKLDWETNQAVISFEKGREL